MRGPRSCGRSAPTPSAGRSADRTGNRTGQGAAGSGRILDTGGRFYATANVTYGDTLWTSYVSVDGELVVNASSEERIEGTLRFTGAQNSFHRQGTAPRGSGMLDRVEPDAPRLAFEGALVAESMAGRFIEDVE